MVMHFSVSLLLLLVLLTVTYECGQSQGHTKTTVAPHTSETRISVVVTNSVTPGLDRKYSTYVVYRGILLGGMRRLEDDDHTFTFIYSEDKNYGPYLESVNGLAGDSSKRTYWQLKVKKANGTIIIPDVGIGCYIPTTNDEIIFNYTTY